VGSAKSLTATERALPVYRLPGLSRKATPVVVELAEQEFPDWHKPVGRPKELSLVDALRLTLCRLRRNATYNDLSEDFGVSVATAWDYHQKMVAFLAEVLGCADEAGLSLLVEGTVCLVDGTLVPTFNWRHRKDLLSGKHRRHGVNVQLLVDLHGRIIRASRAFPGSWHDVHCFREAGWAEIVKRSGGSLGDLGYEGAPDVRTPIKKKPGTPLEDWQRQLNTQFAKVRVAVEWGVGHAKNWRILTSRYRSDLSRIDADIQAASASRRSTSCSLTGT
ncbi:transposase family protein, partial [Parafrankia sp. FMc6]|uniref:transposase family protein n=1 Tax=Parafrankia soli TaxID=2599596 RepID=UPI0034D3E82A